MRATVIEWNGTHLQKELRRLPPGRYLLTMPDDGDELSADEDAAVRAGHDDLAAGRVLPLDDVLRGLCTKIRLSLRSRPIVAVATRKKDSRLVADFLGIRGFLCKAGISPHPFALVASSASRATAAGSRS